MAEFNIRADAIDVEQIMRQIRARIREKRGVDYTEDEIRRLATVKLEKFLEPNGVRSDLLEQFQRRRPEPMDPLNYTFEDDTLYATHRGGLRWIRRLLNPVLKLFFNPGPLAHVLHLQAEINERFYTRNQKREQLDPLYFEVMHNLVLEMTRLGIEVKNLKMRVESLSSRLDFDERRARALEGVVQSRPGAPPAAPAAERPAEADTPADRAPASDEAAEGEARRRKRRRRRRRGARPADEAGGAAAAGAPSGPGGDASDAPDEMDEVPADAPAGDERPAADDATAGEPDPEDQ